MNLYLLEQITDEQLEIPLEKGKGLRAQFAHLDNVRRMWLKMNAKDLLDDNENSDRRKASKEELKSALVSSGEASAKTIGRAESPDRKLKGHRLPAASMVASMIAH